MAQVLNDGLTYANIMAIVAGDALALRERVFVDPDDSVKLAKRLAERVAFGLNPYSPRIGCLGLAFQSTTGDAALREEYYESAKDWQAHLVALAHPSASPSNAVVDRLKAIWPSGVVAEAVEGREMFVGGARVFLEGAAAPPHQDVLASEVEAGNVSASSILCQFAASVYLSVTAEGGELKLWDWKPSTAEFAAYCQHGTSEASRDRISDPAARMKPYPGELIVYDAGKVHAARAAGPGLRAAVSVFVAYRGPDQPLTVWS